jgi:hypothetical protein
VGVADQYYIGRLYCFTSYLSDDVGCEKIDIVSTNSSANDDDVRPLVCYWSTSHSIDDDGYVDLQTTMMRVTTNNDGAMMVLMRIDNQQ